MILGKSSVFFENKKDFKNNVCKNGIGNYIVAGCIIEEPDAFPAAFSLCIPNNPNLPNRFFRDDLFECAARQLRFYERQKDKIVKDINALRELICVPMTKQ